MRGTNAGRVGDIPSAVPARISTMLEDISRIGADGSGGVSRLAFTEDERLTHQLVATWLRDLGLEVREDAIGNTIAVRPGIDPRLPPVALGSHVDSVPHGGRFDGVVGVVGMVEALRVLGEAELVTRHPLLGVIFAAEEGARFGEPCIGSKLLVGALDGTDVHRLRDAQGVTLAEAMTGVGLEPSRTSSARWARRDISLFLELHVEQGGVLEASGSRIGLVDTVSGSTRLRVTFRGIANHSGATPMSHRADALMGAAEVAVAAESLAHETSNRGLRITVGRMDVWPNSTTTIPGRVTMTVDVRDTDSDRQRNVALEVAGLCRWICERRGLGVDVEVIADTSPTVLATWVRDRVRAVCDAMGISTRSMTSGASHDAQVIARLAPTAIIFVPSRGGLSHVPEEWTSAADVASGVDVVVRSIVDFDEFLSDLGAVPTQTRPAADGGGASPEGANDATADP